MSFRNQAGFGHVMLLVGIVVVAAVAFAAWRVMDARQPAATDTATTTTATALPDKIESVDDLAKVSKSLDQGAAQLDHSLDGSQLDADINAML
ncbi:MAG TPA: hypothetical protein VFL85_05525 [Candidatus Saccharimonadales bacterium]|nr:hypothetical protein [Candidatus Saccharimonadales bacterium]